MKNTKDDIEAGLTGYPLVVHFGLWCFELWCRCLSRTYGISPGTPTKHPHPMRVATAPIPTGAPQDH